MTGGNGLGDAYDFADEGGGSVDFDTGRDHVAGLCDGIKVTEDSMI